ncbi:hypothetical protein RHSIM_Rhsim06G0225200 [Rhododendron simsii]|uniref:Ubiquitin-like domain-containing protein n=1 Tax=Rhododendron simsii TaxID=118357 RepID=A0A834GUU6_RHOSS|nr:hypothetical protein RHSIM_Rhsim06G0225200 [Rhododendron simsii]
MDIVSTQATRLALLEVVSCLARELDQQDRMAGIYYLASPVVAQESTKRRVNFDGFKGNQVPSVHYSPRQQYHRSITLNMESCDSVEIVKGNIEVKVGIRPRDQRLIYTGKQLEDGHVLGDYNIHNESTIHVFLFLKLPTSPLPHPQKPYPSRKGIPSLSRSITRMAQLTLIKKERMAPRELPSEADLVIVGKMDTESRKVMALVSRLWRLAVRLVTLQEQVSEQTRKRDRLKKLSAILEKEKDAEKRASRTVHDSNYRFGVERLFNFRSKERHQAYEDISLLARELDQ